MADEEPSMFNFTSFLFGNIDDTGQLEDDILDEECKKHLNSLAKLGLKPLLNEVISAEDIESNNTNTDQNYNEDDKDLMFNTKSPSAMDFSEINELAEDCANDESKADVKVTTELDSSMPPPLVPVSKSVSLSSAEESRKRKLETPLAAMLPEKYANIDVREFFPDFRVGKVNIWRNYWLSVKLKCYILIFTGITIFPSIWSRQIIGAAENLA